MAFGNGPRLVTTGLDLLVDAADRQSYPGSGTVWTDLRSQTTGSLTGSVAYTSEYYGGLTFSNSSSAVIFPGSTANYGTGSFTVEMAFKPTFINGRHYLMSKNSGSFPNWAIYLSGSSGQGKLWSEFNVDASVSCSYSSSTVFQTGSVYQVDVRILPAFSASGIYVNGQSEGGVFGNGGGTLSNTASLFVGNYSLNNTQNFSGSIYTIKTYLGVDLNQPLLNYNATATRIQKNPTPFIPKVFDILVVAGGGSGGTGIGGGGGAGGLQYIISANLTAGLTTITVGNGGSTTSNGADSTFSSVRSIGGGRGGGQSQNSISGGSGGGGGYTNNIGSTGTSGQGNSGGVGSGFSTAGGGGAGSPGGNYNAATGAGRGGSGSYIASFAAIGGSPAGWFAGGGGGGYQPSNTTNGGIGGGGAGGEGNLPGRTGSVNTGGGGGGGAAGGAAGGAGGSGIVAIRYSGTPIALGGEITQSEGYTYHVYRTVGTSSFTIF